jgi:hypothetical protein
MLINIINKLDNLVRTLNNIYTEKEREKESYVVCRMSTYNKMFKYKSKSITNTFIETIVFVLYLYSIENYQYYD